MKNFCLLLFIVVVANFTYCQQASSLKAQATNGQEYSLSAYKGNKIWIIILPGSKSGDAPLLLKRIDSVSRANTNLKTIVVPSYEDNNGTDSLNILLSWYSSSLNSSVILSPPLYTHKSSFTAQDPLFAWLTHANLNTHFDYEITGAGTMFFINENGDLTGISGPEAKFSNKVLNRMIPPIK